MTQWRISSWNGVTQGPYRTRKTAQAAADRVNKREIANGHAAGWHVERVPEYNQPSALAITRRGVIDIGS